MISKKLMFAVLGMALLLMIPAAIRLTSSTSYEIKNQKVVKITPPELKTQVGAQSDPVKIMPLDKTIVLEERNMVVLRGPVTAESVGEVMLELQKMSSRLSKHTPIYLVLDTPGGSVFDGLDLIDFAKALPQKIHTVTLFAASMGFQIAQNLDDRYIVRNGTLMSHRATIGGLSGQIKGEVESRYKMVRRAVDFLDYVAATRMGLTVEQYDDLIVNEYWVHGYDSIEDKAADEQVLLRCGDSLKGTKNVTFQTFLGSVEATFSECPLIKVPLNLDFGGLFKGKDSQDYQELYRVMNLAFEDKVKFFHEYVKTNKYEKFFK